MTRTTTKLVLAFAFGLPIATASTARGAPAQNDESCSIHIWQRGIYRTESASNYGAFGLVGASLQGQYDRKYPAASVEGLIEDVLNINALPTTIASVSWRNYTGVERNDIVFEQNAITDKKFKELRASTTRNSTSSNSCYIELYIGPQTFAGGGIKSHLFSDFYARAFYGNARIQKGAILWDKTPHLSFKDAAGLAEAKRVIADSFTATLTKFLAEKLPKRKNS